jgi:hypothetical protein
LTIKSHHVHADSAIRVTKKNRYNHYRPYSPITGASGEREKIMSDGKSLKLHELTMLPLNPIRTLVQRWWWKRAESHYLICADVEQSRVREAQQNAAYFQKKAALARSQWMGKH